MMGNELFSSPKRILDARHLQPRKRFGQNFLTDPRAARHIAEALPAQAYVVEIGGGTGTLTEALAATARRLTTIEIDRDLAAVLMERFAERGTRVRVVSADILKFDLAEDLRSEAPPRAICGNLPYYITTPILERIFEASDAWECAVLMVQREYARRLVARPKTSEYGSLTVFAAYFARVEKLFDIGAAGFYPSPQVASSVVRLTPRRGPGDLVRNEAALLWLIRAAFQQRRKTLVNAIRGACAKDRGVARAEVESAVRASGLGPHVRGEELALAEFCALADTLTERATIGETWTSRPSKNQ